MNVSVPFGPKLAEALKGHTRASFTQDLAAGLAVGFVALPLAMASAIASDARNPGPKSSRERNRSCRRLQEGVVVNDLRNKRLDDIGAWPGYN